MSDEERPNDDSASEDDDIQSPGKDDDVPSPAEAPERDAEQGPASDPADESEAESLADDRSANQGTDDGQAAADRSGFFDSEPSQPTSEEQSEDSPLSELAERVQERQVATDESSESDLFEEAFEEVGVESADPGELWSELESSGLESPIDEPQSDSERNLYVISKREYCQRCQFFSEPPEVHCNYEGADIVEMEDSEHFKVADCPIVEGVEELRKTR